MRFSSSLLAAILAASAALAACDLPTDPVPTNPYDPAFAGRRKATSPDSVDLAASSLSSVTLTWADRSTFETGFRVERAAVLPTPFVPVYETLAVLPPDTGTYTDATLNDTAPRLYRVTALAEVDGDPSAPLGVRFPSETVALDALAAAAGDVREAWFTADGETLYAATYSGVWTVNARSGAVGARLSGGARVAGLLDGGRVAVVQGLASGPSVAVSTYEGLALVGQVVLEPSGAPGCVAVEAYTVRMSADGRTTAALCTGASLAVWGPAGGRPARTFPTRVGSSFWVDVSRDGARIVASPNTNVETREVSVFGPNGPLWSRTDSGPEDARLLPDGSLVLDAAPGRVRLLDGATGVVRASRVEPGRVRPLSFSADGSVLAYASPESIVTVARVSDLSPVIRLFQSYQQVHAFRPLDGGRAVALRDVSVDLQEIVRWDFARGWEKAPD